MRRLVSSSPNVISLLFPVVIGHDCGHGSFSASPALNAICGHLCHTVIMVPIPNSLLPNFYCYFHTLTHTNRYHFSRGLALTICTIVTTIAKSWTSPILGWRKMSLIKMTSFLDGSCLPRPGTFLHKPTHIYIRTHSLTPTHSLFQCTPFHRKM